MKLIRVHNPVSKQELENLITQHATQKCECGIVSQGSVETFGRNLYNAQYEYWGDYRYTLQECIQWEYDLFITQPLKGGLMEKKAHLKFNTFLPHLNFTEAQGLMDEDVRIDIIDGKEGDILSGIQIKPQTFTKMLGGGDHI